MTKNALEIARLCVAFSGRTVLEDVNAVLPMGGLTVFVGPNGAGKTTLLLCLMGEVPYQGDICFAPGLRDHIGYVPQSIASQTYTPITCGEFLRMNFSRRPLWLPCPAETRRAIDNALARVGLDGLRARCLSELSGGQMRRVLLASALMRKPRLLLLDEPAAGVDLRGERLFWQILDDLRSKEGMSIVMVSHNLHLTAHYATHVLCIHNGRCLEGAPHGVLTARNLMNIFGVPIHLYPDQCSTPQELCPSCGAFRAEDGQLPCASACTCRKCTGGEASLAQSSQTQAAGGQTL